MRLSDAELQWMQTRLAQRYAAAGREAQETLERKLGPRSRRISCF